MPRRVSSASSRSSGIGCRRNASTRWWRPVREFFALPTRRQAAVHARRIPSINRGYAASGTEALSYSIGSDAPPDLFEAFNIGEDAVDYSDPFYAAQQHGAFAPNIWPDMPADLRPALVAYFDVGTSGWP